MSRTSDTTYGGPGLPVESVFLLLGATYDGPTAARLAYPAYVWLSGGLDALYAIGYTRATAYRVQKHIRIALGGPEDGRRKLYSQWKPGAR